MAKFGRRAIDIKGKRYGKLVVIERANFKVTNPNDSQARWLCKCDCGNTTVVRSYNLRKGYIKSCGCGRYELVPSNKLPPGDAAKHRLFSDYKKRAKYEDISFDIDYEDFINLTKRTCEYCGRFPANIIQTRNKRLNESYTYNGIDRRDNTKGYTKENCVTCCEICNRAKKDLSLEDFFAWIHRLIEYNS